MFIWCVCVRDFLNNSSSLAQKGCGYLRIFDALTTARDWLGVWCGYIASHNPEVEGLGPSSATRKAPDWVANRWFLLCGAQKFSLIFALNRVNLYKMTRDESTNKVANPIWNNIFWFHLTSSNISGAEFKSSLRNHGECSYSIWKAVRTLAFYIAIWQGA